MRMFEEMHKFLSSERDHKAHVERINRNFEKLDEKLKNLVISLGKAIQTVAKKGGRRDLVAGIHEQTQSNLTQLKKLKSRIANAFFTYFNYFLQNIVLTSKMLCICCAITLCRVGNWKAEEVCHACSTSVS